MREQHKQAIDRLTEKYCKDARFPALIIVGSIARGKEREDSDVDAVLVASEEEFAWRKEQKAYHFFDFEVSDQKNLYADVKVMNLQYLTDAAEKGSEPARAGFSGAFIAYSRIPGLEDILRRIPVFQEREQEQKLNVFYSQLHPMRFFAIEAIEKDNRFLLANTVNNMLLFGLRIILEQNKILFPSHKGLFAEAAAAQRKPAGIMALADKLLENHSRENIDAFADAILGYDGWAVKPRESIGTYLEHNDWSWAHGGASIYSW